MAMFKTGNGGNGGQERHAPRKLLPAATDTAAGKGRKKPTARSLRPAQVIPLGEGGFKDF